MKIAAEGVKRHQSGARHGRFRQTNQRARGTPMPASMLCVQDGHVKDFLTVVRRLPQYGHDPIHRLQPLECDHLPRRNVGRPEAPEGAGDLMAEEEDGAVALELGLVYAVPAWRISGVEMPSWKRDHSWATSPDFQDWSFSTTSTTRRAPVSCLCTCHATKLAMSAATMSVKRNSTPWVPSTRMTTREIEERKTPASVAHAPTRA